MEALKRVREFVDRESGLAVVITTRRDGSPRASVVNAGVLDHPVTGEAVVAFVSRGEVMKLRDLRRQPRATLVFRSGWDWVAVEGDTQLAGPDDHLDGIADADLAPLLRSIYAAAIGGTTDAWAELDATMAAERHTEVLLRPVRTYPDADERNEPTQDGA